MAYEGELVKLQDGRWARFQRLSVATPDGHASTMLVAVELESRFQRMLDDAQGELWDNHRAPAPVRMSLEADGSVQLSDMAAAQ